MAEGKPAAAGSHSVPGSCRWPSHRLHDAFSIQAWRKHPGTAAGSRKAQRRQAAAAATAAAAAVRKSPSSSQTFPAYSKNNKGQQACYCGVTGAPGRTGPGKDTSGGSRCSRHKGGGGRGRGSCFGEELRLGGFAERTRRRSASRLKDRWQSRVRCEELLMVRESRRYMHIKSVFWIGLG